jgi:glutathione-regulated potassium-efflux system ancillary protein KefF
MAACLSPVASGASCTLLHDSPAAEERFRCRRWRLFTIRDYCTRHRQCSQHRARHILTHEAAGRRRDGRIRVIVELHHCWQPRRDRAPRCPIMSDILVLAAHPQLEHSRVSRTFLEAAAGVARVTVHDLYAMYPDYVIDARHEQAALQRAGLLVWLHPIHWYGMTPLMKLWLDEVLAFGWAYGPGGTALHGKDVWLVASTGGSQDAYRTDGHNRYFFDAFLPPYDQTAALCGMRFIPPMVVHGAHRIDDAELVAHATVFAERLRDYPAWPELADLAPCEIREVPLTDRPAEAA